jgi:hypothetical protein
MYSRREVTRRSTPRQVCCGSRPGGNDLARLAWPGAYRYASTCEIGAVLSGSEHGNCGAADEPFGDEEIGNPPEPRDDDIGWDGMASG